MGYRKPDTSVGRIQAIKVGEFPQANFPDNSYRSYKDFLTRPVSSGADVLNFESRQAGELLQKDSNKGGASGFLNVASAPPAWLAMEA